MGKRLIDVSPDVLPGPDSGPGWERKRSDACVWLPAIDKDTGLPEASRTEQSHKDSCDINVLMAKYERGGELPRGPDGQMFYGDFSQVGDYKSALDAVYAAQDAFDQMPASLKKRFGHDPQQLLEFLASDVNRAEAVSLGLVNPAAPPLVNPIPDVTAAVPVAPPGSTPGA